MVDFSDPAKWEIRRGVPVLDEHELVGRDGSPEGFVDANILREIAANNNRRVHETGDPAPLIVGHTSDLEGAPERPVVGYAINYRVAPFRNGRQAIFADFAVRRKYASVLDDYPRRSVELWLSKRELDPIALLGGSSPERDLGLTIRKARNQMGFRAIALLGSTAPERDLGVTLRYSRKAKGNVLFYAMDGDCAPVNTNRGGVMHPDRYGMGEEDDLDDTGGGEDEGAGGGGGAGGFDDDQDDGTGEDPVVAKVLASKPMRDLMDKVNTIFEAVTGGAEGGAGPGAGAPGGDLGGTDDGMGMGGGGGGAPPPGGGMGGGMGGAPGGGGNPDDEAAMFHGAPPVRFEQGDEEDAGARDYAAGSGFAGPASGFTPGTNFGGKGKKPFSRNGHANKIGTGGGNVNGTRTRGRAPLARPAGMPGGNSEVVRLKRQVQDMALKLARADAKEAVAGLKAEGVLFGESREEAEKNEREETEFLAQLDPQSQAWHLSRIRRLYKRRDAEPTQPGPFGPLSQYARGGPETQGADAEGEFEPRTPQEAMEYAEKINRVGPVEAIKYMRGRGKARR